MNKIFSFLVSLFLSVGLIAEDGYDLWLRYKPVENKQLLASYKQNITGIVINGNSDIIASAKKELSLALKGLLGATPSFVNSVQKNGALLIGTNASSEIAKLNIGKTDKIGEEGYIILTKKVNGFQTTIITANTEIGVLYGVFHLLRLMQTNQSLANLDITSSPKTKLRLLNHWDNLNRSVERGYAGMSLWNWHTLPGYIDPRYVDYARANASIGINGTVLTNVNANATILTPQYLEKVAALAKVFRAYGIKVYLPARFSAPIDIGGLKTADPLSDSVKNWWNEKVNEIYKFIPDFGGFIVKANSEGQPGPQNYKRTHADGANLLADALAPHNGIVMWRAFVYSNETPDDRHKQAYNEFVPLDGKFRDNVLVQVKNGAIDFQPREPFHPLFGAMPKTPLMMEFQLTQEYLGFSTHLVYMGTLFKECLDSDTYTKGKGTTVAKIVDGTTDGHSLNGIAGVANIGNDINWCGHPFGQANWYALGRLTWDHDLSAEQIADEWIRMSFSNDASFIGPVKKMMMISRETTVRYMTPIGLHHIMGAGHHYGPAPWNNRMSRADWNSTYYHRADSAGIGFNRTKTGSDAISQYNPEVQKKWETPAATDEKFLLWFHHLPWTYKVKSGRSLWDELCYQYNAGVDSVRWMQKTWQAMKGKIDDRRFEQVTMLLQVQADEAKWWRNACLLYFQTFSKMPIPARYEQPDKTLEYYMQLRFQYAPGN